MPTSARISSWPCWPTSCAIPWRRSATPCRSCNWKGPTGANFRWSIEVIEDQIKHMTRMVDDLLDVSRITRGKVDLQKETIAAGGRRRPGRRSQPAAHRRLSSSTYGHTSARSRSSWKSIRARLAQVLSNLLNNAAKYTDEGGEISLFAETRGDEVVIRVRDNGIGISADLLPRVFDLFTQADRTLSRSRGGLGIGLTLVRSLIELHGGRVAAHSAGLGHGSEFVVALPTAASSAKPAQHPDAADGCRDIQLPRRRILVVDDKRSNAQSLEVLLRALGQEVYTAYDGTEALEMARQHRPDVVLLDIGLPIIDGYEVARRCREQPELQRTALVAMTGYGQDSDRQRSHEAGFNAHLVKPVDLDNLLSLLSQPDFAPHSP